MGRRAVTVPHSYAPGGLAVSHGDGFKAGFADVITSSSLNVLYLKDLGGGPGISALCFAASRRRTQGVRRRGQGELGPPMAMKDGIAADSRRAAHAAPPSPAQRSADRDSAPGHPRVRTTVSAAARWCRSAPALVAGERGELSTKSRASAANGCTREAQPSTRRSCAPMPKRSTNTSPPSASNRARQDRRCRLERVDRRQAQRRAPGHRSARPAAEADVARQLLPWRARPRRPDDRAFAVQRPGR